MAHQHGIEGLDESNSSKRAKAWDLVQQQRDAAEAEQHALEARAQEEAAAAAQAASARVTVTRRPADLPTHRPVAPAAHGIAGLGGMGLSLKNALTVDPVDKRMGVMAAMQAEALARLEIAPHADQVLAEQRTIERSDPIAIEDDHALTKVKRDDAARKGTDSAGRKAAPEALKKPTDRVAPTPKSAKPGERPKDQ